MDQLVFGLDPIFRREGQPIRPTRRVQEAFRRSAAPGAPTAPRVLQTTLARAVTLSGEGVHGGRPARATLAPSLEGCGIILSVAGVEIPATWRHVEATLLRTRLAGDGVGVSTVEHLLAALSAMGVDNAMVEVEGDEIPAMDGSAGAFVDAIEEAGVVALAAPRVALKVVAPVRVANGAGWAELAPAASGLRLDVEIAFAPPVGRQRLALDLTPDVFRRELARARSFGFLRDAERLWREGLALGASLENTLVFDGAGALNPQGLRFTNEVARHKMLDVVGDLALAGAPIIGAFRSFRGGHALNVALLDAAMRAGALAPAEIVAHGAAAQALPISP